MALYAFCLRELYANYQRGQIPDDDLVLFSVHLNQELKGWLSGRVPAVVTGSRTPFVACETIRFGGSALFAGGPRRRRVPETHWIVGPMEIAPTDLVTVAIVGTNLSDGGLSDRDAEQFEIDVLDKITHFVTGGQLLALGESGLLGREISAVLKDPVGAFLGLRRRGPCNGLAFVDGYTFTGGGLAELPFGPAASSETVIPAVTEAVLPPHHVTDEAQHDRDRCGHIAETEATMSVLRWAHAAVRVFEDQSWSGHAELAAPPSGTLSLRQDLLRL